MSKETFIGKSSLLLLFCVNFYCIYFPCSEYELEYLLLEGHCFEANTGSPPRGLQITLGVESKPVMVDTIVMANLGYFQLKANPGVWLLRLRQGRSADIYDIVRYKETTATKFMLISNYTISYFFPVMTEILLRIIR